MKSEIYTSVEELIQDTRMGKPHVVILGAGASLQAFPNGDKNGKKLPLMCDLVKTVGLDSEFEECGIDCKDKNFEDIYGELYERREYSRLLDFIDYKIRDYFSTLRLPSYPTIYDHLVLSLRKKDLIASFNWDPLLYLACWRNHDKVDIPSVVYLHGNVAIGHCLKDTTYGWINMKCNICGNNYVPSKLLYPIRQKNYSQDPFIKMQWNVFNDALQKAYVLTIFGYSAPQSDKDAVDIIKSACSNNPLNDIAQVEIIDIKSKNDIRSTWSDLIYNIYRFHYDLIDDFYNSSIALFPRRTCEAQWDYSMPEKPIFYPHNPVPRDIEFKELLEWYNPLVKAEK